MMVGADPMLQRIDSVLADDELAVKARASLLVGVCEYCSLFEPERLPHYWSQLEPVIREVPKEKSDNAAELAEMIKEDGGGTKKEGKGFAAELIAEAGAAVELVTSDREAAIELLEKCEARLNARKWPGGKSGARTALANAWARVDRSRAISLTGDINRRASEGLVRRLNKDSALGKDEWKLLVERLSLKQVVKIAREIFESDETLNLPPDVLLGVGDSIMKSMPLAPVDLDEVQKFHIEYVKLIISHEGKVGPETLFMLVDKMCKLLTTTTAFEKKWPSRFVMLADTIKFGVLAGALTDATFKELVREMPKYLVNFAWSCFLAAKAPEKGYESAFAQLMEQTGSDESSETLFVVRLAMSGEFDAAVAIASKSKCAVELLKRVRIAALCSNPESCKGKVTPEDMGDDMVGAFLASESQEDRVAYLRELTAEGTVIPKGFWDEMHGSDKNIFASIKDSIVMSDTFMSITKKDEQLSEYAKLHGYARYKYQDFDKQFLEALVAWGDREPTEVRNLLEVMWKAIEPDDTQLQLDIMRNNIFERCRNLFCADPDKFTDPFVDWLYEELVKKGRRWQIGDRVTTLKMPNDIPLRYCIAGAATVKEFSPKRCDSIILSGLQRYPAKPEVVKTLASIYSSDKEFLELIPPCDLNSELTEAWQQGIVENVFRQLVRTAAAEAIQKMAPDDPSTKKTLEERDGKEMVEKEEQAEAVAESPIMQGQQQARKPDQEKEALLERAERTGSPIEIACDECGRLCKALGKLLAPNAIMVMDSDTAIVASRYCKTCGIVVCGACAGVSSGDVGLKVGGRPCPRCHQETDYAAACHLRETNTRLL